MRNKALREQELKKYLPIGQEIHKECKKIDSQYGIKHEEITTEKEQVCSAILYLIAKGRVKSTNDLWSSIVKLEPYNQYTSDDVDDGFDLLAEFGFIDVDENQNINITETARNLLEDYLIDIDESCLIVEDEDLLSVKVFQYMHQKFNTLWDDNEENSREIAENLIKESAQLFDESISLKENMDRLSFEFKKEKEKSFGKLYSAMKRILCEDLKGEELKINIKHLLEGDLQDLCETYDKIIKFTNPNLEKLNFDNLVYEVTNLDDKKGNFNAFKIHLMMKGDANKKVVQFIEQNNINWSAIFSDGNTISSKYLDILIIKKGIRINWNVELPDGQKMSEKYKSFYELNNKTVMKRVINNGVSSNNSEDISYLSRIGFQDLVKTYLSLILGGELQKKSYIVDKSNYGKPIYASSNSKLISTEQEESFNAFQLYLMMERDVDKEVVNQFVKESDIDWGATFSDGQTICEKYKINNDFIKFVMLKVIDQNTFLDIKDISFLARTQFKDLIKTYESLKEEFQKDPYKNSLHITERFNNKPIAAPYSQFISTEQRMSFNAFQLYLMMEKGADKEVVNQFVKERDIDWNAELSDGQKMSNKYPDLYEQDKELSFLGCKEGDSNAFKIHDMMNKKNNEEAVQNIIERGHYINWNVELSDGQKMSEKYSSLYKLNNSLVMLRAINQGVFSNSSRDIFYLANIKFEDLVQTHDSLKKEWLIGRFEKFVEEHKYLKNELNLYQENLLHYIVDKSNDSKPIYASSNSKLISTEQEESFNAFQLYLMMEKGANKEVVAQFVKDSDINWDATFLSGQKMSNKYPDLYKQDKKFISLKKEELNKLKPSNSIAPSGQENLRVRSEERKGETNELKTRGL